MVNQFSRTELLFGKDNLEKLKNARVIVFGLGGVGSFVVEALARSGVGAIDVVDNDEYSLTNLNRQLFATHSTLGRAKVDVAEERVRELNPDCRVTKFKTFFTPENADQFDFSIYDYIVDCIDTVSGKLELVMRAKALKKPIISCMGAGNKVDPTKFKVADITRTSVCPLARVMRNELKKRGIKRLKCVFSTEPAIKPVAGPDAEMKGNGIAPGSNAFTPSVAGLIMAGEVVKDLTQFHVTDLFKE